ncbi:substrate-binding domain-containing protein [Vulcanisaeta souniana]|uniref:Sugar ABC transporter substrate-binding protein n=1 Tax=Vulcanisaeta souniana JCM 11219 TaxID=1293586 RepID=A0A830E6I0_9CREN|nr:substrate-binding domain-containing protein [Vulcanisaeta souniana]BDR92631.1 sugar ABC transporter substrate-binding protein [Vulcanisaeta souniana JCM 11219]GGI87578.1 sugar ABC transporter substrate-binding protein [Vulcanisaeta souniana JCM 11219]
MKTREEENEELAKAVINTFVRNPVTRRKALSTMAKAGIIAGLVAAFGAGFGTGYATAPPKSTGYTPPPKGYIYGLDVEHPELSLWFVNHVTTNPFFTPTIYGIQDACNMIGNCKYVWTGSENSVVTDMVNAIYSAISSGADGIATTVIAPNSFDAPIQEALSKGIPVYAYNAYIPNDDPHYAQYHNPPYLGYVGQDLYSSGELIANKWILPNIKPNQRVALFIATPGTANIQPRIDGILSVLQANGYSTVDVVATGALVSQEQSAVEAYFDGHPDVAAMIAVDAGSTLSIGNVLREHGIPSLTNGGKILAGGYDLLPGTVSNIVDGYLDFTIDQQPYLQGFLPALYLYLYLLTNGLEVVYFSNTGIKFVTKQNVTPYTYTSRFEGSTTSEPVWTTGMYPQLTNSTSS